MPPQPCPRSLVSTVSAGLLLIAGATVAGCGEDPRAEQIEQARQAREAERAKQEAATTGPTRYPTTSATWPASTPSRPAGARSTPGSANPGKKQQTRAPDDGQGTLAGAARRRADQIISTFENSTTTIQYGYAENLDDGRGVTAGRAGFCTACGDAVLVVERYAKRRPGNALAGFLPELRDLADDDSDDTNELPEDAYIAAWRRAAADPAFQAVQDEVVDQLYFRPAMRHARQAGLRTPLALAQLYDATIQHGDGDDQDSVGALVRRATERAGGTPRTGVAERAWLAAFFAVRIADLQDPHDSDTADEWSDSVDRVRCMQRIAATGNYALSGPLRFTVFGTLFRVS